MSTGDQNARPSRHGAIKLEEIRREKKVAEEAVQSILAKLAERTGLTPASVDFGFIDRTTMMDERQRFTVGPVTITLEGI